MSLAKATPEAIEQAVEQLEAAGENPSYRKISAMTGGSWTTIGKYLPELLERRRSETRKAAELPEDLAKLSCDLAIKMATAIYSRVDQFADERVEQIESGARERIASAQENLKEALGEIERLEGELQRATESLSNERSVTAQANARADIAEGRAAQQEAELGRLTTALTAAQAAERKALADAAALGGQIAALEKLIAGNGVAKTSGKKS